jgi:hypothetical protein
VRSMRRCFAMGRESWEETEGVGGQKVVYNSFGQTIASKVGKERLISEGW